MPNPTPSQPSNAAPATPATPAKAPVAENKPAIPAGNAAEIKKPVVDAPKKYKVKVDNQEREVEERELIENYQLRQLSDKKRSEAEKKMAEFTKAWDLFKNDPIKFHKAAGSDFDALATSYLAKKAEESMQDPKERELKAAQAEAAQYKKWVEEQKTAQAKAEQDTVVSGERQRIHQEIISAIQEQKELGMPVDEELVIAIAQKMKLQDKKQQPLNAKDGVMKAYESSQKFLHGIGSKMDGEALVKWLGPDMAKKIRQYDLARLKAKRGQPQSGNSLVKPKDAAKEVPNKPMTWSEFKKTKLDTIQ